MGATVAEKRPVKIALEADKDYYYCSCGLSENQPFCDGSHKGTEFSPVKFSVKESSERWLCQCKATGDQPFCDGKHKTLTEEQVGTKLPD